jgi:membrane protease subunit HflC
MIFFQVRFTETAVVMTFGKPSKPILDAGLYRKWPWPIQKVVKYDGRVRILHDAEEQVLTNDAKSIIVIAFTGWRIENPHTFLTKVGTEEDAELLIRDVVRNHKINVIGQYDLSQLINTDPNQLKFREIEDRILELTKDSTQEFGVAVETQGIKRLSLPEATSRQVFDAMKETRLKMAARYEAEGQAKATEIKSNAEVKSKRITSYVDKLAREIENKAQAEAAELYAHFEKQPDLAEFLLQLNFLKNTFGEQALIILDPTTEKAVSLFSTPPSVSVEPTTKENAAAPPTKAPDDVKTASQTPLDKVLTGE